MATPAETEAASTKTMATAEEYDGEERDDSRYSKQIRKISEKGVYEFEFVEGSRAGERVKLPRQKISNRIMLELEEDRAEYASMLQGFKDRTITKEQRREAAQAMTNLYAKLAKYYFHINREDFDLMDWDSTKPNIDAAANVSVRGRPNLV